MKKAVLFWALFASCFSVLQAQKLQALQEVLSLVPETPVLTASSTGAIPLKSLVADKLPVAHFEKGKLAAMAMSPATVIETDVQSLSGIKAANTQLQQAELLRITLKSAADLGRKPDFSGISSLAGLKYVLVLAEFNTTPGQLERWLGSAITSSNLQWLYTVSIPQ
ncbi:MAG TPA: hypothetical protein PKD90_16880 [Phnomibacter sp.]|nr:hypothetical protein [Phnomibacter sp.]